MFRSRDEIVKALLAYRHDGAETEFTLDLAKTLADLAREGMQLDTIKTGKEPTIGVSKIGGIPDLPINVDWPVRPSLPDAASRYLENTKAPDGKWNWATPEQCDNFRADAAKRANYLGQAMPLPFLAQLNLAELNPDGLLHDLPGQGMLYLFYDIIEQPWGFDPKDRLGSKLLWYAGAADQLTRTPPPQTLETLQIEGVNITPRTIVARRAMFPIGSEEAAIAALNLPESLSDDYFECMASEYESVDENEDNGQADHRLQGHPFIIQNAMQDECALVSAGKYCGNGDAYRDPANKNIIATANDWQLLLQIDSDDEDGGYMWGDSGTLYVWLRKQDLAVQAFDKSVVIVQCC